MSQGNVSVKKINIIVCIIFIFILGVSVIAQINMNKKTQLCRVKLRWTRQKMCLRPMQAMERI